MLFRSDNMENPQYLPWQVYCITEGNPFLPRERADWLVSPSKVAGHVTDTLSKPSIHFISLKEQAFARSHYSGVALRSTYDAYFPVGSIWRSSTIKEHEI